MDKKKWSAVIIGIITAAAGGSYAFDLSTTNIDDHSTTINEGDSDVCPVLRQVCDNETIPEEYVQGCKVIDVICR